MQTLQNAPAEIAPVGSFGENFDQTSTLGLDEAAIASAVNYAVQRSRPELVGSFDPKLVEEVIAAAEAICIEALGSGMRSGYKTQQDLAAEGIVPLPIGHEFMREDVLNDYLSREKHRIEQAGDQPGAEANPGDDHHKIVGYNRTQAAVVLRALSIGTHDPARGVDAADALLHVEHVDPAVFRWAEEHDIIDDYAAQSVATLQEHLDS